MYIMLVMLYYACELYKVCMLMSVSQWSCVWFTDQNIVLLQSILMIVIVNGVFLRMFVSVFSFIHTGVNNNNHKDNKLFMK